MFDTWVAQEVQRIQLTEENDLGIFEQFFGRTLSSAEFLAEMNEYEGDLIPFVIRMGPSNEPDPGTRKKFSAVEIDGDGRAFVMIWIDNRLVSKGWLYAQETPGKVRRLGIPRGLRTGYGIDIMIAHQGTLLAAEVFWDPVSSSQGGQE